MFGRISHLKVLFPNDLEFTGVPVIRNIARRITDNKRWPNVAGLKKDSYTKEHYKPKTHFTNMTYLHSNSYASLNNSTSSQTPHSTFAIALAMRIISISS